MRLHRMHDPSGQSVPGLHSVTRHDAINQSIFLLCFLERILIQQPLGAYADLEFSKIHPGESSPGTRQTHAYMGAGYRNRQRIRDCGILPPPPPAGMMVYLTNDLVELPDIVAYAMHTPGALTFPHAP